VHGARKRTLRQAELIAPNAYSGPHMRIDLTLGSWHAVIFFCGFR